MIGFFTGALDMGGVIRRKSGLMTVWVTIGSWQGVQLKLKKAYAISNLNCRNETCVCNYSFKHFPIQIVIAP